MKNKTVAILGVGLIGGSLGKAILRRGLFKKVIGVGRNPEKLEKALKARAITEFSTNLKAVSSADLVILCTPVARIKETFKKLSKLLKPGCIVTDAGSTKEEIVSAAGKFLPEDIFFVGSHPIAGSEKSGIDHSGPELFKGAACVVTPVKTTNKQALLEIKKLWSRLGGKIVSMSPAEHDRVVALTSHVPHFLASALTLSAVRKNKNDRLLIGKGFRDTTRVASGNPEVWCEIAQTNKKNIKEGLDELIKNIRKIKAEIGGTKLRRTLAKARDLREGL
ncbi:MAG: prephenate dehydrogenase [Candidatus Firestonebacteria bacterium]